MTDIVSEIAGLPLKPVMDYELGVCNVQVITPALTLKYSWSASSAHFIKHATTKISTRNCKHHLHVLLSRSYSQFQVPDTRGDDESVLVDDWHKDSYPYVAIVMLSDPRPGLGGEMVIQRGDGTVLPIAFPTAGSCVVLQAWDFTSGANSTRSCQVWRYLELARCHASVSSFYSPVLAIRGHQLSLTLYENVLHLHAKLKIDWERVLRKRHFCSPR